MVIIIHLFFGLVDCCLPETAMAKPDVHNQLQQNHGTDHHQTGNPKANATKLPYILDYKNIKCSVIVKRYINMFL